MNFTNTYSIAMLLFVLVVGCSSKNAGDNDSGSVPDSSASIDAGSGDAAEDVSNEAGNLESWIDENNPENVISRFEHHSCESHTDVGVLFTGVDSKDYTGLECIVVKKKEDGAILIDHMNSYSPCEEDMSEIWRVEAILDHEGRIAIFEEWQIDSQPTCGYCLSHWSFEIDAPTEKEIIDISVSRRNCISKDCEKREVAGASLSTIPDNVSITCKYASLGNNDSPRGALHMPPREEEPPCDGKLVTEKVGGSMRCVTPCEIDANCRRDNFLICSDGICILKDEWDYE
jgi:hypothetical protein